jgi:subtilisin family serine protease
MIKHQLEIVVTDSEHHRLSDARVRVDPEAQGKTVEAQFDPIRELYFFDGLNPGFFTLCLKHTRFEPQSARIQVHPAPTSESFIMNPEGTPYTLQGGTRVPYQSRPELLGVIFSFEQVIDRDAIREIESLFNELRLETLQPLIIESQINEARSPDAPQIRDSVIVRRDIIPPENDNHDLRRLRESQWIEAAGPIFQVREERFKIFTNRIMVRFRPEVTYSEIRQVLDKYQLELLQPMNYAPSLFLVEADREIGEGINRKAEQLVDTGLVIYAEPSIAEVYGFHSVTPNDYLWPAGWDRHRVNAEAAWKGLRTKYGPGGQFGRPDIIIAVVDYGVKSAGGIAEHPDLNENVSDGNPKAYKFFDFIRMVDNNDISTDHGVQCASIALGAANNSTGSSSLAIGVAGVAPNTRFMGLVCPYDRPKVIEMYLWAAGLSFTSSQANFPPPISPGTDIFTCSLAINESYPLPLAVRDMFDAITTRGRGGRGCLAFFSAGNEAGDVVECAPYGTYVRSISCAASTIDTAGQEVRARYSCHGFQISWCAPSSSSFGPIRFHNPPEDYATWSACFLDKGTVPSLPEFTTTLTCDSPKDSTVLCVQQTGGLIPDKPILIKEPGAQGGEAVRFKRVLNPERGQIEIEPLILIGGTGLSNDHTVSEVVAAGKPDHSHRFGGTSSAAPLCAGIGGLVLSANPELTWIEAKQILSDTATKIDKYNEDSLASWLDEDFNQSNTSGKPPVFSRVYGHGRLDADKAVKAALAYRFRRDLMIRKDLDDDGKTHRFSTDSPDIWVRNSDPTVDTGAIPLKYNQPGPHQAPSRSKQQWIYARIKNRGTKTSLNAWVRFYIASFNGAAFLYPEDWESKNGLGNITPGTWARGTYFIGEVALPAIKKRKHYTVHIPWPEELLPPELTSDGKPWNPYLLVEIVPHDGPLNGNQISDNNNLAQKEISIIS